MERTERNNYELPSIQLKRLQYPRLWRYRDEWAQELFDGRFHAGQVVSMITDEKMPSSITVYYDGGRRRIENNEEGIVLEGIRTSTQKVLEQGIEIGDIVQTNWAFAGLEKLGSQADLNAQGIQVNLPPFDAGRVIGVLIWENDY
jgi:hypothetical protein